MFYRLNVIEITLPPLRERLDDLPVLCDFLLRRIATESNTAPPVVSDSMLQQLVKHSFPGNVRELENILYRAVALHDGGELKLQGLESPLDEGMTPAPSNPSAAAPRIPGDLQSHLDQQEREILVQALQQTGFNRTAAAAMLGLNLRQIRYRIARLNIDIKGDVGERDEPQ